MPLPQYCRIACLCLLVFSFANTASAGEAPKATLKLYNGGDLSANYYGSGPLVLTRSMCVWSETGAFRLRFEMQGALAATELGNSMTLRVKFPDGRSEDRAASSNLIVFQGMSLPTESKCERGPNSEFSLIIPEASLTGAVAGSYIDMAQISVEPI